MGKIVLKDREVCSFLRDFNILSYDVGSAHKQTQWGQWGSLSSNMCGKYAEVHVCLSTAQVRSAKLL